MSIELAICLVMGIAGSKRVLIYDEAGFSRICSAFLELSGCRTDILAETPVMLDSAEVGLFVTSYPYGAFMLEEVQKRSIPALVLFDNIDDGFVNLLQTYQNMYCMIKPLDYDKFKGVVLRLLGGEAISRDERMTIS